MTSYEGVELSPHGAVIDPLVERSKQREVRLNEGMSLEVPVTGCSYYENTYKQRLIIEGIVTHPGYPDLLVANVWLDFGNSGLEHPEGTVKEIVTFPRGYKLSVLKPVIPEDDPVRPSKSAILDTLDGLHVAATGIVIYKQR